MYYTISKQPFINYMFAAKEEENIATNFICAFNLPLSLKNTQLINKHYFS